MSKSKLDAKTTKNLITSYKSIIAQYTKENLSLSQKLQDLKTTLNLNQDLLYDFISNSIGKNEEIKNLINENKELWKGNEKLLQQKNDLELKTSKLQEMIEDTPMKIKEEIQMINESNEKLKVQLIQKDQTIKKLKSELEKARKNALFKTAKTEVLVTDPTKVNVEINHELLNTKAILFKVSKMHANEKQKAEILDKEIKALQEEVVALRKNTNENHSNYNNCSLGDFERENEDERENNIKYESQKNKVNTTSGIVPKLDFGKVEKEFKGNEQFMEKVDIKDNLEVVSFSESEEDEEEEKEKESEESYHSYNEEPKGKKKEKTKQRELDILNEEYAKLKKQNEEFECKIQKYKSIYKEMKIKIQNLNQISKRQVKIERNHNNIILLAPSTDDATSHKNV